MTKISIVLPYKNSGKYLLECLDSIQNQSYDNWELIAVNDGSVDSSEKLIEEKALKDARIKPCTNKGNGIIDALQTAWKQVAGTYITRIDADDIMTRDRLKLMVETLKNAPEKTIVTGNVSYFSSDTVSEGYQKYEQWLNDTNRTGNQWQQIYRECVIASPNWMTRKNDMVEMGGFSDLKYPEDYHLVLKWYRLGFSIEHIDQVTLLWREHPERTSRNSAHYGQESFFRMKLTCFLDHDWNGHPIIIWGKNQKSKLIKKIFHAGAVPFEQHEINEHEKIEKLTDFQLLVAVYPEPKQRKLIIKYLESIGKKEGKDWWWV